MVLKESRSPLSQQSWRICGTEGIQVAVIRVSNLGGFVVLKESRSPLSESAILEDLC